VEREPIAGWWLVIHKPDGAGAAPAD